MKTTRSYWAQYLITFICVSFAFFYIFFQKGISFVRYADAYYQHLPALEYYSEWLKTSISNLLNNKSIPTYSLSIGYGGDILSTLNYYGAGDPLNLIVVFANKYNIAYFYNGLIFLRIFLSGVFFSLFIQEKGYKLNLKSLCGTLVYCFSGWAVVAPLTHIFFGSLLLYLPLIILGSERIIKGQSNKVFVLSVFFLAISNFYFLFVGIIITAVYVITELVINKKGANDYFRCIIRHLYSGLIALFLSAPILLPVCLAAINSTRTSNGAQITLLYDLEYYIHIIKNFFSYNSNEKWLVFGFSPIVLIAIIHSVYQRKKLSIYIALCLICIVFPVFGAALNGFNYSSNKWLAANSFVLSISVIQLLSDEKSKRECVVISLIAIVSLSINYFFNEKNGLVIFLAGCMLLGTLWSESRIKRIGKGIAYSMAIIALCIFPMCYSWNQELTDIEDQYMPLDVLTTKDRYYWDTNDAQLIKEMEGDPTEELYRFTGDIRMNSGITDGMSSTSAYWSLLDRGYMEFYRELAIIENSSYNQVKGIDSRSALFYLSNSRYSVSTQGNLPYGLVSTSVGRIYKSIQSMPFGYSYNRVANLKETVNKNPLEKELIMLKAAIVEEETGVKPLPNGEYPLASELSYTIYTADEIEYEKDTINVLHEDGVLYLIIDECDCSGEFGLFIEGLDYQNDLQDVPIEISFLSGTDVLVNKTLKYTTPSNHWYSDRHDFYISSGYQDGGVDRIAIKFKHSGNYTVKNLRILLNDDQVGLEKAISELSQNALNDVDFSCDNKILAINEINATIRSDDQRFVCLTIPYSKGWHLFVDGREQKMFRTNYLFTGFTVAPGDHLITLRYKTPGIEVGMLVAFLTTVFLVLKIMLKKNCIVKG